MRPFSAPLRACHANLKNQNNGQQKAIDPVAISAGIVLSKKKMMQIPNRPEPHVTGQMSSTVRCRRRRAFKPLLSARNV
jgi:hypothetical protein